MPLARNHHRGSQHIRYRCRCTVPLPLSYRCRCHFVSRHFVLSVFGGFFGGFTVCGLGRKCKVVAHPVAAPLAMVRTEAVKSHRCGRRTAVPVCRAWTAAGTRVVVEGTAPQGTSLHPRRGAAGLGVSTSVPRTSLGAEVAARPSAVPATEAKNGRRNDKCQLPLHSRY